MKVLKEFRVGNRRYRKGERYTGADAKKFMEAGFLEREAKATKAKGEK